MYVFKVPVISVDVFIYSEISNRRTTSDKVVLSAVISIFEITTSDGRCRLVSSQARQFYLFMYPFIQKWITLSLKLTLRWQFESVADCSRTFSADPWCSLPSLSVHTWWFDKTDCVSHNGFEKCQYERYQLSKFGRLWWRIRYLSIYT